MDIWAKIKKWLDKPQAASWSVWDDRWYAPFIPTETAAGAKVDPVSAMNIPAVWDCIKIISEDIASLPLHLYRRLEKGKERAVNHPLYYLLHDQPNPEMSAMSFRETMAAHLLSWGNCYAEKEMDGNNRVKALWPIAPNAVQVFRSRNTGKIFYEVGLPNGETQVLRKELMFHVPGLSFNGLIGYSPIHKMREAIGLAMALEEFGARFFGSGTHPGLVISHPGKLSETGSKNLRESMISLYSGLGKSHRLMVLEEAMKPESIGIPPEEAQFLQTRKFQLAEIARIYRIPLHMLAELDRATFSNIEQQSLEYVKYTLRPWLVRFEQAYTNQFFVTSLETRRYFWEHLIDGLLRGDLKSRYEAYAIARQWGWYSADDIREKENENPLPDGKGDIYLIPMNMIPVGDGGELERPEPPEPPESKEEPEEETAQAPNKGNGKVPPNLENRCHSCERLLFVGLGHVEIMCRCGTYNHFANDLNLEKRHAYS